MGEGSRGDRSRGDGKMLRLSGLPLRAALGEAGRGVREGLSVGEAVGEGDRVPTRSRLVDPCLLTPRESEPCLARDVNQSMKEAQNLMPVPWSGSD